MANLKEAFEYASQNPDSDFARNLEQLAGSGALNKEAQKYGIDLSPFQQKKTLVDQLGERAKTFASEVTLKPSRDMLSADANTTGQDRELAGLAGINRAFQSPIRAVGAVGGAIGDVVGAGLEATGIDKVIGGAVAPIAQLDPVQKAMQVYQSLPQDTQEVLGSILNTANIPLGGVGFGVAKSGAKTAFDAINDISKTGTSKIATKAVDFISADPEKKVATILKESTPQELDNYLSIAEKASVDPRIATPFEFVGNKLSDTTKILEQRLKEIGKAKSDIVQPTREGLGSFKKETTPLIQKLTSLKNSFGEIEQGSKSKVQAIINDAKTVSTKLDADTFIDKVQNALYSGNIDMTIPRGSSLDKQLRGIIGEYNSSLKKALPKEYAQLNDQYSKLIDSLDTINRSLGEVVEGVPVRGASLIKQFFSPSGTKAKEIFDFVKKETNGQIDLAKDSTLAKFSMELFDDPRAKSLLQGIPDIPTTFGGVATKIAEKLGGEKLQESMRASTIRKAKEISSPKSGLESGLKTTNQVESKLFPSPESTPTTPKSKGIRGMVNPSELLPKKKVVSDVPKTVKIWNKSKFSNDGAYADIPVIRREDNITLYQGGSEEGRQFWTPDKKYAEQFGKVKSKTGSFYKVDNGNRVTDVYVEVPSKKAPTSLEQEAKKYKSAEEFVKAQGVQAFHGTPEKFDKFDISKTGKSTDSGMFGKGFYFTNDIKEAKTYSTRNGKTGEVKDVILNLKNPLVLNSKNDIPKINVPMDTIEQMRNAGKNYSEAFTKYLKDNGFDGVIDKISGNKIQYVVLDNTQIKTKKELIDIWNKANKTASKADDSLVSEAKKYKSAEEFVKAQGTPVYHGTPNNSFIKNGMDFGSFSEPSAYKDNAIYFSSNKNVARSYTGAERLFDESLHSPEVIEATIGLKNPLVVDAKGSIWRKFEIEINGNKIVGTRNLEKYAKENGYDGLVVKNVIDMRETPKKITKDMLGTNYAVFNPKLIKTKQQLVDIWNKANKK